MVIVDTHADWVSGWSTSTAPCATPTSISSPAPKESEIYLLRSPKNQRVMTLELLVTVQEQGIKPHIVTEVFKAIMSKTHCQPTFRTISGAALSHTVRQLSPQMSVSFLVQIEQLKGKTLHMHIVQKPMAQNDYVVHGNVWCFCTQTHQHCCRFRVYVVLEQYE